MDSKSTDELLKIWRENDREKYSNNAFEAVKIILQDRKTSLPTQSPEKQDKSTPYRSYLGWTGFAMLAIGIVLSSIINRPGRMLPVIAIGPISIATQVVADVFVSACILGGIVCLITNFIRKRRYDKQEKQT